MVKIMHDFNASKLLKTLEFLYEGVSSHNTNISVSFLILGISLSE
jgi:hypothetical protein